MKRILYFAAAALIFGLGVWLRFDNLATKPLWVDEAFFFFLAQDTISNQEFVPVIISKFISLFTHLDEFWLRFPFALFGSLTGLVILLHKKDSIASLVASLIYATCPLFVFWSKTARPYAIAAFFIALGWRYWPFYILAVLTTPISLLGLNWIKIFEKRQRTLFICLYLLLVAVSVASFLIRPDSGKDWHPEFILNAKRLWIIPLTAALLYCLEYFLPYLKSKNSK